MRTRVFQLALLVFVVPVSSCTSCDRNATVVSAPRIEVAEPAVTENETMPQPTRPAPVARPAPVDGVPDDVNAAFVRAANSLGTRVYARLRERDGNFAISPASIELAMAMTALGARGETATQMADVLGLGDERAHAAAANLLHRWNDPEQSDYELRVVNRLFGKQSYEFEQDFLFRTRTSYAAPLESLDIGGDPEAARLHINAWVAGQTGDRIRELLPPGSIEAATPLVLTNAVYLLAKWMQPFPRGSTREVAFHAGADTSVQAPFMHNQSSYPYAENDAVQVLELRYRGDDFSMIVVLPKERHGLAAVEAALDADAVDRWVSALSSERVNVALPKWEIDPGSPIEIAEQLAALGMPLPFDRARADLSAMAPAPTPDDRLFISDVFHQAFVKVDEEGTEAAAATAVVVGPAGAAPGPSDPPKRFIADHPFLFFIRDVQSGALLFLGRVNDPTS